MLQCTIQLSSVLTSVVYCSLPAQSGEQRAAVCLEDRQGLPGVVGLAGRLASEAALLALEARWRVSLAACAAAGGVRFRSTASSAASSSLAWRSTAWSADSAVCACSSNTRPTSSSSLVAASASIVACSLRRVSLSCTGGQHEKQGRAKEHEKHAL